MVLANSLNSSTSGLQSLTSAGMMNGRTLTGTANQISVSNGDGVAGNPTVSLTSTIYVSGISFDSGSNTLDTYVTGTFTPTVTGSSSNPSISYSSQVGVYERIGNVVIFTYDGEIDTGSGGSGNVRLSGLPYTSRNTTNLLIACPLIQRQVAGATFIGMQAELQPNSTFLNVAKINSLMAYTYSIIGDLKFTSPGTFFRTTGAYYI